MAYKHREAWLEAAVLALEPVFSEVMAPLYKGDDGQIHSIPPLRVSCGWPSRHATSRSRQRIGECWDVEDAADGKNHVFVSPVLEDPIEVLETLVHEIVHAVVGGSKVGHRAPFRRLALAVGLEGKMTATRAGSLLRDRLAAFSAALGEYPHGAITLKARKMKQGTRMLKAECPCGAIIRLTRKVIDHPGLPTCACGEAFEVKAGTTQDPEPTGR